jgi:hypothetical protein
MVNKRKHRKRQKKAIRRKKKTNIQYLAWVTEVTRVKMRLGNGNIAILHHGQAVKENCSLQIGNRLKDLNLVECDHNSDGTITTRTVTGVFKVVQGVPRAVWKRYAKQKGE